MTRGLGLDFDCIVQRGIYIIAPVIFDFFGTPFVGEIPSLGI